MTHCPPAPRRARPSFAFWLRPAQLPAWFRRWREIRQTRAALRDISDHIACDIGLDRADLERLRHEHPSQLAKAPRI